MNLLNYIYSELHKQGKTLSDVEWIGCEEFQIPLDNFMECANVECDDDMVAEDLVLFGSDFAFCRHHHGWFYTEWPKPPKTIKRVRSLIKTEGSEARRWADDESELCLNSLKYMVDEA